MFYRLLDISDFVIFSPRSKKSQRNIKKSSPLISISHWLEIVQKAKKFFNCFLCGTIESWLEQNIEESSWFPSKWRRKFMVGSENFYHSVCETENPCTFIIMNCHITRFTYWNDKHFEIERVKWIVKHPWVVMKRNDFWRRFKHVKAFAGRIKTIQSRCTQTLIRCRKSLRRNFWKVLKEFLWDSILVNNEACSHFFKNVSLNSRMNVYRLFVSFACL